ncbi:MAG: ACP S-malonyltransferase, partial [Lawsonibacter sp.]|nr:ACP S-malonyltransferase [Lawsonibacter sp.]
TQPCMAAFAVGVTDLLYQEGIRPQLAAGLSLGEYSALYAAGVFSRGTVISTVALRGRAMEEAAAGLDCSMTAVLGLDREKLQQACDGAAELGTVQICNYNCPGQLVIGGEKAAVDKARELAKELGAKRCMPLKVSGPFHTRLMKPAGDALAAHFKTIDFQPMALPVYFNCLGGPMDAGDNIPALLERQVQSSVYWEDTIRRMEAEGVDTVVEIGPGKALSGFFKKTAPGIRTCHIDTAADFHSVVSALKGVTA